MAWIENTPGSVDTCTGSEGGGRPVHDCDSKLCEHRVISDSLTGRLTTCDSLRISEAKLAHAQRIARLGNFSIDLNQMKFTSSDELYRIFGYETHKCLFTFKEFRKMIHPDDVHSFMKAYHYSYRTRTSLKTSFRINRRDGTTRALYLEADYTFDGKNMPIAVFGIVQDITERRRTEDALRESDTRFSVLANTTSCAISIIQDGKFVYANPALCDLVGYPPAEIIGKPYLALVHADYLDMVITEFYKRVWRGEAPPSRELKLARKDGTEIWAEIHVGVIDHNGRMATIITAFDVTAYKQADEVIRASLREKELMLKEIHHRVKNNMQIISSLLSLQASHLDQVDPATAFKNSQNRVRSMAIVHEMLYQSEDLAHINFKAYIDKLLLSLYTSYQVDLNKIQINVNTNDISLDIEKAVPCGLIINELLSNAFKYAFREKDRGTINITLRKKADPDTCILVIGDDGIGLPPEIDLERIETLGLQLVDALVSQLDGWMTVDRTAGTAYTVEFMLCGTEEAPCQKNDI